jgi:hypothetical protein
MGDAVIAICDLRAVPDGTVGSRVWDWRDGTAAGQADVAVISAIVEVAIDAGA